MFADVTRTYLYGPAVCCKPDVSDGGIGLHICIRPVSRALVLLAIMDIRAHPLSFSKRPSEANRFSRSRMRRRDRFSISSIRLADLGSPLSAIGRSKLLRCLCYDACFVIAPLGQDRPRDARQLVGERGCQNIVMQPLRRGRKPLSKAMSCPICRSEQDTRAPCMNSVRK